MPTSSSPPIGAIAFGRSGVASIITALEEDRVILRVADGSLKRVPMSAITRWELPPLPTPSPFPVGTTVGKAHNLGWLGWVQTEPIDGWCDVLWQYDKHPTLEKLSDLKIKETR